MVTRAKGQAETLAARLRALGADAVEMPTIEIRPAADYGPLDRAIAELGAYDWLIFTSANGVRFFMDRLDRSAADLRALRARICAIGPATRAAIEALHLKVDLMGKEYVAEGLLEAFASHDLAGSRVLLPRAAVARDLVPAELARRGARVDVVEAYRTVVPGGAGERIRESFRRRAQTGWIAFTSSSTVQNFVNAAGGTAVLDGVKIVSIGPVTTRTARELGLEVAAEARPFTVDGIVDALRGVVWRLLRGRVVSAPPGGPQRRQAARRNHLDLDGVIACRRAAGWWARSRSHSGCAAPRRFWRRYREGRADRPESGGRRSARRCRSAGPARPASSGDERQPVDADGIDDGVAFAHQVLQLAGSVAAAVIAAIGNDQQGLAALARISSFRAAPGRWHPSARCGPWDCGKVRAGTRSPRSPGVRRHHQFRPRR